jgi:hypothetical protein
MSHGALSKSAALLIIGASVVSIAAKPVQAGMDRDPQLRQAQAAANRIVERFHRTLDFDGIIADEFVTDAKLKGRALTFDDEDKWKKFDVATRERLYLAMMTWLHLWAEYMIIQKENDVPPELAKSTEPRVFSHSGPPQTMAELNDDISEFQQMSAVYRKYFPPGVFQSAPYRESVKQQAEYVKSHANNVPRIEKGNAKFGIPESVPVYVVRPESFDYYFIEEKGGMKLFYVNILPDFRLF